MDFILFFIWVSGGPRVLCFFSGTHSTRLTKLLHIYIKKKNPTQTLTQILFPSNLSHPQAASLTLRPPLSLRCLSLTLRPDHLTSSPSGLHTSTPNHLIVSLSPSSRHNSTPRFDLTLRSAAVKLHNHTAISPSPRSNLPRLTSPKSPQISFFFSFFFFAVIFVF